MELREGAEVIQHTEHGHVAEGITRGAGHRAGIGAGGGRGGRRGDIVAGGIGPGNVGSIELPLPPCRSGRDDAETRRAAAGGGHALGMLRDELPAERGIGEARRGIHSGQSGRAIAEPALGDEAGEAREVLFVDHCAGDVIGAEAQVFAAPGNIESQHGGLAGRAGRGIERVALRGEETEGRNLPAAETSLGRGIAQPQSTQVHGIWAGVVDFKEVAWRETVTAIPLIELHRGTTVERRGIGIRRAGRRGGEQRVVRRTAAE